MLLFYCVSPWIVLRSSSPFHANRRMFASLNRCFKSTIDQLSLLRKRWRLDATVNTVIYIKCKIASFTDEQFQGSCQWVKIQLVLPEFHFKPLFTPASKRASIKRSERLIRIILTNFYSLIHSTREPDLGDLHVNPNRATCLGIALQVWWPWCPSCACPPRPASCALWSPGRNRWWRTLWFCPGSPPERTSGGPRS